MPTEYLHPRAEEIAGLLPVRRFRRLSGSAKAMGRIDRIFKHGRRLRSDSLTAFVTIYLFGGLKTWRRGTLRHAEERAHIDDWLARARAARNRDYALGVDIWRTRRLIRGYSDTHARGLAKYDRVIAGIAMVEGRANAVEWTARLRTPRYRTKKDRRSMAH